MFLSILIRGERILDFQKTLRLVFSNVIDYGDICACDTDQATDPGSECREFMSVVDQEDMMGQYPWVVYVILAEMFTRIIPSFLLVILNTKMIKRFHEVIEKRGIMRAKNFMEGTSKLNLTYTENTKIQDDDDNDDHVSYELGVGVTVIRSRGTSREKVAMSEDDGGGERRSSEQARLVCKLSLSSQLFSPWKFGTNNRT